MSVTLSPFSRPLPGSGAPDMVVVMDGAHQEPAWSLGRLDALPETPSASDLQLLAALDPADLSDPMDVITYLQRVEKVEAFLAALKVTGVGRPRRRAGLALVDG